MRKSGYYKVVYQGEWEIMKYDAEHDGWYWMGSLLKDYNLDLIDDNEVSPVAGVY